ncbi:MAG: hypothetical protein ABI182_00720, partial [Candidatus Baltobacteraceae bacterium]
TTVETAAESGDGALGADPNPAHATVPSVSAVLAVIARTVRAFCASPTMCPEPFPQTAIYPVDEV